MLIVWLSFRAKREIFLRFRFSCAIALPRLLSPLNCDISCRMHASSPCENVLLAKNKEKFRLWHQEWARKHRDELREYNVKYWANAENAERRRRYNAGRREQTSAAVRKYRENNRDKLLLASREYVREHRDEINRRRAMERAARKLSDLGVSPTLAAINELERRLTS